MTPVLQTGAHDFVQYWSAYQVLVAGGNPYRIAEMARVASTLGLPEPVMMWNPPFLPLLLSPILSMSFSDATLTFLVTNVGFWLLSSLICLWMVRCVVFLRGTRNSGFAILSAALVFYPVFDCMVSGQVGLLLLFLGIVSGWFLAVGRWFLGGVVASLLCVKPHLAILGVGTFAWGVPGTARWPFLLGFFSGLALLLGISVTMFPESLGHYLHTFLGPNAEGAAAVVYWRNESLSGVVRGFIFDVSGDMAPGLMSLFPIVGVLTAIPFARAIPERYLVERFLLLLGWAVVWSPYAWMSDYALLLPAQIVLARMCVSAGRVGWVWGVVGLNLLAVSLRHVVHFHHLMPFVALGLLLAVMWGEKNPSAPRSLG